MYHGACLTALLNFQNGTSLEGHLGEAIPLPEDLSIQDYIHDLVPKPPLVRRPAGECFKTIQVCFKSIHTVNITVSYFPGQGAPQSYRATGEPGMKPLEVLKQVSRSSFTS